MERWEARGRLPPRVCKYSHQDPLANQRGTVDQRISTSNLVLLDIYVGLNEGKITTKMKRKLTDKHKQNRLWSDYNRKTNDIFSTWNST